MKFSRTEKAPSATAASPLQTRVEPDQLRSFEDFKDLGQDDLVMLCHFFSVERMRPGAVLFNIGANDNRDYLLLEGQIDLIAADGRRTEIPSSSPRASQPIARLRPRKFKAEVVLPSVIISIDREELGRLSKLLKTDESIRVFDVTDPHLSSYSFYLSLTADLSARRLNWFIPTRSGSNSTKNWNTPTPSGYPQRCWRIRCSAHVFFGAVTF